MIIIVKFPITLLQVFLIHRKEFNVLVFTPDSKFVTDRSEGDHKNR